MKFGVFFEMTMPRPWDAGSEKRKLDETLEQIKLADDIGMHCAWMTEHHFMEEYCHATAPEVVLSAAADRTKRIRIAHGVRHAPPPFNHPARTAEMASTLDLVSNGRLELGFGSSGTEMELGGFGIRGEDKRDMSWEAIEQICNMMAMEPFPGYQGKFFKMPARNVVPKPLQKPHPPLWLACSQRPSILDAASRGMGALSFAFLEANDAKIWRDEYYTKFMADCRPIGHTVNPNFNLFTAIGVHKDEQTAVDRFLGGLFFFQYMINHYYASGGDGKKITHKPGRTNLWEHFLKAEAQLREEQHDMYKQRQIAANRSGIGSVAQVRKRLTDLRDAGVDQVTFLMQMGKTKHEHICEALELFAKEIMPEFVEDDIKREKKKQAGMEPYIEKAFERIGGRKPTHLPDDQIQDITPQQYMVYSKENDTILGLKKQQEPAK